MHTLPASYGLFFLTVMRDRGHAEADILAGTTLTGERLQDAAGRISSDDYLTLLGNLRRISADPGLCCELGLRSQLTKHGFVGFGLMSCATLRDAIELGRRYLEARVPLFTCALSLEGADCVVDLRETIALGELRDFALTFVAIELCCLFGRLQGSRRPPPAWRGEIRLPFAEPAWHADWKNRVPPLSFGHERCQIVFPVRQLDHAFATANPVAAELAIAQCEQELATLRAARPGLVEQVRRQLVCQDGHYPDLATVAQQLCLSGRTLKRRLQDKGLSFQQLLDDCRAQDSKRLLARPQLSVEQVAEAVGYRDPANFTRAFRKWTGLSPRAWRQQSNATAGAGAGPI